MNDLTYVDVLLRRGIAAARDGRKEDARQALLEVTQLDEQNEQAWLWLSGVVDSLEDRRVCLENVLAIDPENPHALQGLRWLDQQASPPTAQEHCPRCQSPVPSSGMSCPHCGQLLVVACPGCGQYVEVEEVVCSECGQFLGNFRSGARYHLVLARAYLEHHRYAQVQEAIERAEAEALDDPQGLEEVAALHEKMGHTDLAIAVYQRAIERHPEDAIFYARLGAIYRRRAMPDDARAMYERSVMLSGDDPVVLFELAQLYVEEDGVTLAACDLLEWAVQMNPEYAEAHLLLSDVYVGLGKSKQAVQHYQRATELTAASTVVGQEARRKLGRLRPSLPDGETQGWGETARRTAGLVLSPALAMLVNARLRPLEISLAAWGALFVVIAGAFLWACAADVPRGPAMRAVFGEAGAKGTWRQALVGAPGVLMWAVGFGLILAKV